MWTASKVQKQKQAWLLCHQLVTLHQVQYLSTVLLPGFEEEKKPRSLVSAQFSFKMSLLLYIWKLEILAVKCYTQEWFFLYVCLYHCNQ